MMSNKTSFEVYLDELCRELDLKINKARMKPSVDTDNIRNLEEQSVIAVTRNLLFECDGIVELLPILHSAAPVPYWVHYRQSVV